MRSPARPRPEPQRVAWKSGRWIGFGPLIRDAVTGTMVPRVLTVTQRGGRVIANWNRRSSGRDRPKEW